MPPFAIGNIASITLCPVTIGSEGASFDAYGLAFLTGHFCIRVISKVLPASFFMAPILSVIVKSPADILSTVPSLPKGTSIL